MAGQTRVVQFAEGVNVGGPAQTFISTNAFDIFVDDAAFVAAKGSAAADGDAYYNTTLDVLRIYADGAWTSTIAAAGSQTVSGDKTFSGTLDVTGTLSIDGVPFDQSPKKNIIQNGNFDFWQRREDFGSFTGISSTTYTTDRFRYQVEATGAALTSQPSTTTPSPSSTAIDSHFSMRTDVTTADASIAAGDFVGIEQSIEGPDAGQMDGKELTFSFWVRSSTTGTYCFYMQNTGRSRSYVKEFSISVADTWEKKEITFTHDSTGSWAYAESNEGAIIGIALSAGSDFHGTDDTWSGADDRATSSQTNLLATISNTFYLSQVKLEIGPSATRFARAAGSMASEFETCKRYFESVSVPTAFYFGAGRTLPGNRIDASFGYSVRKQGTPSASIVDANGVAGSPASLSVYLTSAETGTAGASAAFSFPVLGESNGMIRLTADNTVTGSRVGTFSPGSNLFIRIDAEF